MPYLPAALGTFVTGKWLCDSRFGGYEAAIRQTDCYGLDCLGRCIETGLTTDDFCRIVDPLKESNFHDFFADRYNSMTDSKFQFGFLR